MQKGGGLESSRLPCHARDPKSVRMARSYYGTIFRQSADEVWNVVRDFNFNNYPGWVGGPCQSVIEAGKSNDTVGAIRSVLYGGRHIRQQLPSLLDVDKSMTYYFAGEPPRPCRTCRRRSAPRCRWRTGVRRMVGELRLRGRDTKTRRHLSRSLRRLARILAAALGAAGRRTDVILRMRRLTLPSPSPGA